MAVTAQWSRSLIHGKVSRWENNGLLDRRNKDSEERDTVGGGEGVTVLFARSIIDYDLSPPEAPDVNQAV